MVTARVTALESDVTVVRDRYGIPHIYGSAIEDVVCALGYVHATERMWQMDMLRRVAQGRLAEVLGERVFERDTFCRTLGFKRAAEECLEAMQEDSLSYRCLEAYCRGVNARVEEVSPDGLPAYFKVLDYRMEPWRPLDTLSFLRYVAWLVSGSFDDLWLLTVVDALGADAMDAVYPFERPYEMPVVQYRRLSKARRIRSEIPKDLAGLTEAARDVLDRARRTGFLRRARGRPGSNNWAVDAAKSATGRAILCNDLHLEFGLPSVWYLAHLVSDDMNVAGGTFPGIPAVIVGRNDHIAWGMTSTRADVADYFYERVHPEDRSRYRYKARWRRFETVKEEVAVIGESPREIDIELTVHGPVLTREGQTLTMRWAGHDPSDELEAVLRLNLARNFGDFLDAVRFVGVPAQNFAYADDEGNIGIIPAGRFPIRRRGLGRVPHSGSSGAFDWDRFIPFRKLRYVLNPDCHYVASANQRPFGRGYRYYLGWQWAAGYRARRVAHLLGANETVDVEDMRRFQFDVHDCAAEAFLPALFSAFQEEEPEESVANALALLKTWDFKAEPDSVAATIWVSWFLSVQETMWRDVWRKVGVDPEGWSSIEDYYCDPPSELLEQIVREQFDNTKQGWLDVSEGEALYALVRESFRKALKNLVIKAGEDMQEWNWGRFNRARFESLSRIEDLSRKDVPVGGTVFTLNPGGDLNEVDRGATLRFIASFDAADTMLAVYPGGQSEDGSSPHYFDLFGLWVQGDYVQLALYQSADRFSEEETESVTILRPG